MPRDEPDEPYDRAAAVAAIRADVAARATAEGRRRAARDDVVARSVAAGWRTGPRDVGFVMTVFAAALVCGSLAVIGSGGDVVVLCLAAIPLAPFALVAQDLRRGPLPRPRTIECAVGGWGVPAVCAVVGAAVGLVVGWVLGSVVDAPRRCGLDEDCFSTDPSLPILIYGPVAVLVGCALILVLARVRHPLFIAALGPLSMLIFATGTAAVTGVRSAQPVLLLAAGVLGYGLSGVSLARVLSPVARASALAAMLVVPTIAVILTR